MTDHAHAPRRIAIVQTAFLGDVVFTSPLVRALKASYPASEITLVTTPKAAPLAACIPGVAAVVPFDKRKADRGLAGLLRVAKRLARPDLVLVPHPSVRSAALARLSGAPRRIGHARAFARAFYTDVAELRGREPFVQRYLDLSRVLTIDGPTALALEAPAEEVTKAKALLAGKPAVALVVGSEWGTKRWPAEKFAALADALGERGFRAVLVGAPSERPIGEQVRAAARKAELVDVMGNSIVESLGILAAVDGVVGGDSGLVHAARGLGKPTVVLFGPTDPGVHELEPHARALRVGLECQPCHAHGPQVCPLGHHDCMRKLEPQRVLSLLTALLSARAA